jgi:23S rRNA (cytidine1920-2'-O)/16S rRNA (cytidine1409-2'-O)-methyltransferase
MLRLDSYLAKQESISRSRAQLMISEGLVSVNNIVVYKASLLVSKKDSIVLTKTIKYVSRGYLKLSKAIDYFKIDLLNKKALDVGASTGGFTQLLLEKGVSSVIAMDVGSGQLDDILKLDKRVTLLENLNIKDMKPDIFDIVVVDISFISLTKVVCNLKNFIDTNGIILVLIKPQFELGNKIIGKKGVVKDLALIDQVVKKVIISFEEHDLLFKGITESPILGKKGNIEFLALFQKKC